MRWNDRVARALREPKIRDGIAKAIAAAAKRHIATSSGRGADGREAALEPLQDMTGEFWTTRKPPVDVIPKATRKRTVMKSRKNAKGQMVARKVVVTEYLLTSESYRKGGQPLRDTGNLQRSLAAKASNTKPRRITVTMSGALYGIFHERGFETDGPNFIPLTRKGKRSHATGRNPAGEGLVRGKDFTMAWDGVKVPARPFLVPTNKEWSDIGRTIRMGLAKLLKGRT